MAGQLTVSPTFISVSIWDRVVVDLMNKLHYTTTSIHWHELYMHFGPVNGEYKGHNGGGSGEQAPLHHLHPLAWALNAWWASKR